MVLLQTCKGNFKIELKHFLQYTFFSPLASSTKDRNSSICLIVGGVKSFTGMWRNPILHSSHRKGQLHVMTKKKANVKRNICSETVVYYEIYSDLPSGMFGFEDVKATRYATPSSCKYLKCPV